MTNGSYQNSGKKLKKDLASKYTFDIGAKGKDNSTGVGFATFLSKDEFDKQITNLENNQSAVIY